MIVFEEIRFTAGNIMSPMKQIATTIISVSCLLGLLFIAPSALAKEGEAQIGRVQDRSGEPEHEVSK
jgi:hypothetical protein